MCNNVYNVYTLYMYICKHMYMYMYVCNYHPLEDNIKLIFMPSVEFYSSCLISSPADDAWFRVLRGHLYLSAACPATAGQTA